MALGDRVEPGWEVKSFDHGDEPVAPDIRDAVADDVAAGLATYADPTVALEDVDEERAVGWKLRRVRTEPTQVWLRGTAGLKVVMSEVPWPRHVFRPTEIRKGIRPHKLLTDFLPRSLDFEWLVVNRDHASYFKRSTFEDDGSHIRVPVWGYGDDPTLLLRYCHEAPRQGWPFVVVGFLPRGNPNEMLRMNEWLFRVGANFPHVRLHLTMAQTTNYSQLFGMNFASVDVHLLTRSKYPKVMLPNGKETVVAHTAPHLKWLHVLGFSAKDLVSVDDRIRFNLASLAWASEHWNEPEAMSAKPRPRQDPLGLLNGPKEYRRARKQTLRRALRYDRPSPDAYGQISPDPAEPYHMVQPVTNTPFIPVTPRGGYNADKISCSFCSLADTCKQFREGSICTVSDSPTAKLAALTGTRDAEVVKEALLSILEAQRDRYLRSAEAFRDDDDSDIKDLRKSDHLMKMENSVMRNLEVLVKILDPGYRPDGPVPALQSSTINVYNPQILVAEVMRELDSRGIDRAALTPDVLQQMLKERQKELPS